MSADIDVNSTDTTLNAEETVNIGVKDNNVEILDPHKFVESNDTLYENSVEGNSGDSEYSSDLINIIELAPYESFMGGDDLLYNTMDTTNNDNNEYAGSGMVLGLTSNNTSNIEPYVCTDLGNVVNNGSDAISLFDGAYCCPSYYSTLGVSLDLFNGGIQDSNLLLSSNENLLAVNENEILKESVANVNSYNDLVNAINSKSTTINILSNIQITGQITINYENLIINGNGYILSSNNKHRCFYISSKGNLTINDLTFRNFGTTSIDGGAIGSQNGINNVIFSHCNFYNNYGRYGGALNFGVTRNITFEYCNFQGNRAQSVGALRFIGYDNGYITITHCNFTNNRAQGGSGKQGGALACDCFESEISYCNFNNNYAALNGGAIIFYSGAKNSIVSYCNFTSNSCPDVGGAIYFRNAGVYNITVYRCNFKDCTSNSNGGALYFAVNDCSVIECNFTGNKAVHGAGIFFAASGSKIVNSTIILNKASGNGGGVYYQGSTCSLSGSVLTNNSAVNGGAIYFSGSYCNLTDSVIDFNTATTSGGGVKFTGTSCNITGCNFTNNTVTGEGHGGAVHFAGKDSEMWNCIYSNNTCLLGDGGALCSQAEGSTVAYCNFTGRNNTAKTGNDFYAHPGCTITFIGLKFRELWLTNLDYEDILSPGMETDVAHGYGTGYERPACWDNDDIWRSFLDWESGAQLTIYLVGTITNLTEKTLDIPNLQIIGYNPTNNPNPTVVDMDGWNHRAFTVTADSISFTNITFKNSNIKNNATDNDGGVVMWLGDDGSVVNCSFNNNKAVNGSCIYLGSEGVFIIDNCIFRYNNASYGGAVFVDNCTNQSFVLNSVFQYNTAYLGGGIYINDHVYYYVDDATRNNFEGNVYTSEVIVGNYSDIYDGHAYKTRSIVYIVRNPREDADGSIENPAGLIDGFNMVSPNGLIIFCNSSEIYDYNQHLKYTFVKNNVSIIGNDSSLVNISLNIYKYAKDLKFSNFVFKGNDEYTFIWNAANGIIYNSTFTENSGGNGTCIKVYADNLIINYTRFINNHALINGSCGGAVFVAADNLLIVDSSFINNGASDCGNHLYIGNMTNNITVLNSCFINSSCIGNGSGIVVLGKDVYFVSCLFANNSAVNGSALYIGSDGVNITNSYFACPKYDENNNIIEGYVYSKYNVNLKNNTLSFTDLNHVVENANANLDLEYNYKYFEDYDASFQSGVRIDETLRINGHSYRLNGGGLARVFRVSADNVDLSNLTFVDAHVISGNGGAIIWSGNDGSISDSFFINCSAVNAGSAWNYGGAVSISGSNMNITDCAFDSCVSNGGSALEISKGNSVITNCIFINNNADQYDGAIWYDGTNSGNFVLSDCIFRGNNASRWGGALRVDSKGSINNCIFENNAVVYSHKTISGAGNGYGGAIYLTGNGVSIINSTFKGNYVDNLTSMCGGGIYASKAFTLNNCYFMNNSASNGSAIYYVNNTDLNIDSCTFANPRYDQTNNRLAGYIYSTRAINFNNVSLSFTDLNHTIANSGGSLDLLFNYMFFNEFDQKFVSGVPISKDFTINGNSFILDGNHSARIFNVTGYNTVFSNLTFTNGNATLGGAIYVIGNITVLNSNFTNNSAVLGGAIFIESGYSNLSNCTFNNNTATNGSAIYIITSVNHWDNLDFINNIASTNATIYFREDSTVYSNNLTFTDNIIPNGLHIVGENHIYSPVIYVNATRQGFGIIMSEPTSITRAVDNILDNGVIIICSDYTLETIIRMNNLTNVTVTGNHTLRKGKYLFILPIIQKYIKKKQIVF